MRMIDADALMADLEKWLKQIDPTHPPEDNAIPPMEDIIVSTLMTIEEQPTIEPQRWIPVTPDSPPLYMPVLTWDGETRHVEQRIPYIRDEIGEKIFNDWWIDGDEKWDEWAEYQPNLRDGCAIKWMPLPEPWRGEEDDA